LPLVTVVVPTLAGDEALAECLEALGRQSFADFEVIVVDNSGKGLARRHQGATVMVKEGSTNLGYGGAINAGARDGVSRYVAALNDDAIPMPEWLGALVRELELHEDAGSCASLVMLAGSGRIDSAGMLLCADGSSKQRGHGLPAVQFHRSEDVLLPSGSAALYRRVMLDQVGWFDQDYFLYCEDTDLGLRAQWAGWKCRYAADAVVQHRYSHSAGRASRLKAYYVERNRLRTAVKSLPATMLWKAPFATISRYFWHAWLALGHRGAAGRYRQEGAGIFSLAWFAFRAHVSLAANLFKLCKQRGGIRSQARISTGEFLGLVRRHSISPREVARQ
jgi:GT2 family glycosyltransferase